MKGTRFNEEQIIGVLKEGQAGMPVQELTRKKSQDYLIATIQNVKILVQAAASHRCPLSSRLACCSEFLSRASPAPASRLQDPEPQRT